jgi:protein phosphatase PTC7
LQFNENPNALISDVLNDALTATKAVGSSTVCIARLHPQDQTLTAFNIGDSGFRVLRPKKPLVASSGFLSKLVQLSGNGNSASDDCKYEVIAKSEPMMHDENTPFQVGSKEAPTADKSASALVSLVDVSIGDMVILGSDGLFDNMDDDEIEECFQNVPMENEASPNKLAWYIGRKAQKKYDVIDY